jgi:putative ABC transport system permease protein
MLLRAYRHLRPKEDDTFAMLTSDALLDFWNQLTGAIAATAVAVVSVFMVVGGVVIMNIMLAVVTERTHEIGIRKSVGARKRDILNQFLVESAVLAASGGLIGVIIAWVVAVLVRTFTPVPMSVPVTAVVVGVTLVGGGGPVLRHLPGAAAAQTGSHRSPEGGEMTLVDRHRERAWRWTPSARTRCGRSSPCWA